MIAALTYLHDSMAVIFGRMVSPAEYCGNNHGKMPKELLVSDESYNSYNIRVLTSGGDFTRFNANPIMLLNHNRISSNQQGVLPIGTWQLRVDGNKIFGTPSFDMEDEFAAKIAGKYERGVIRSASLGLKVIEMQEDGPDEQGNMRYTITKWQLQEISLVDIPSNENAVAVYGDDDEKLELSAIIELAEGNTKIKLPMKYQNVPTLLGLSADASDNAVTAEVNKLLKLRTENANLKAQKEQLEAKLNAQHEAQIAEIVQKAVDDKKIQLSDKDHYIKLMNADYESTSAILASMQPQLKLIDVPRSGAADNGDKVKHKGMTFSELQRKDSGALMELKTRDFEAFNELYKSEFGKDYNK